MNNEKENAPAKSLAEANPKTLDTRHSKINLTTSPGEIIAAFKNLLRVLPPELQPQYERFHLHVVTNALRSDDVISNLAALLPSLNITPAGQILHTDYPDIISIVDDYLTAGVWFIYGMPKIGKSWLGGQVGLAIATGGTVFGKNVKRGRVLYLALEDGERRLKRRMLLQHWPSDVAIDYMLPKDFREQIGPLNLAGGKRLLAYIEQHDYLATIVDTFSRGFNVNQLKSDALTDALAPFQEFTQRTNRVIIFIDHEPKRNDENATAITALFGGIAKVGVADGVWRLYKERGKSVRIDIEGRDLEDTYSLKLHFDKSQCYWYSEGDAEKLELTERRKQIIDALANLGRCSLGQLEDATGQPKGHLHTRLQDLVTEGIVKREKTGANVFYSMTE